MNTTPDDLTPNLAGLAANLRNLPFPGPDAAARSRMRAHFEAVMARPPRPWWMRRLYIGIVVATLGLGLGAAGAADRSPVDVVRDPGGIVQDIVDGIAGRDHRPIPVQETATPPSAEDDDDDTIVPGSDDDDGFDDDNVGPGPSDDDDAFDNDFDDGSAPGTDDDAELDDGSAPGSDDDAELDDDSGPSSDDEDNDGPETDDDDGNDD